MKFHPILRRSLSPISPALVLAVAIAAGGVSAKAADLISPTLNNGGFDDTTVKVASGFDDATTNVPFWQNAGTNYSDSGVEAGGTPNAQSAPTYAFLRGDNDGAFQITSYQLSEGDQISLTWSSKNVYNNGGQTVSIIESATQAGTYSSAITLASGSSAQPAFALVQTGNGGAYQTFTLTYTATAQDAGRYAGVFFDNTGDGGGYTFFDDFTLTVVPEPSSVLLCVAGMVGMMTMRRQRRS